MYKLPGYLRDSYYAQKYEAEINSGLTVPEPLPTHFLDDKAVPPVIAVSSDKMEVKFIGMHTSQLTAIKFCTRLTFEKVP